LFFRLAITSFVTLALTFFITLPVTFAATFAVAVFTATVDVGLAVAAGGALDGEAGAAAKEGLTVAGSAFAFVTSVVVPGRRSQVP
jgi:hypothetical protein